VKARVSIRLPADLLRAIDRHAKQQKTSRSHFIEGAVQAFIRQLAPDGQNARDLEIINRRANRLNWEANDVLEFSRR
jgi:metal-responsive CopG/Arc/MetJ family transcriptional regulator